MARTEESGPKAVVALALPPLAGFDLERLQPGGNYEATLFTELDLSAQDARDSRFMECRLERCCVDGLAMARTRVIDCLMVDNYGASVDLADSTWRDSLIRGGRLGAITLPGARLSGVRFKGIKLGFVNLAAARLEDVVFEECEIGGIDARASELNAVAFGGCVIGELNITEARLSKVNLSAAKVRTLVGVENLRGAIIRHEQLVDLAPLLAAQLGVEVRPDPD